MNFQDEFTRLKIANFAKQIGAKRYNESSLQTGCLLIPATANYQFGVQKEDRNSTAGSLLTYYKFLKREDLFLATSIDVFKIRASDEEKIYPLTQGNYYTELLDSTEKAQNTLAQKGFLTISQNQEVVAKDIPLLDFYNENTRAYLNASQENISLRLLKVGEMAKILTPYIVFSGEKSQDISLSYDQITSNAFEENYTTILVKFSGILFPGRSSQLSTLESLVSASQQ